MFRRMFCLSEIVHMVKMHSHFGYPPADISEWLFQHVAAVIHHGGAGTTACGLANACPTTIVPFFGE